MPDTELKRYRFASRAQWAAGQWTGFELLEQGLGVPTRRTLEPLTGAGPADRGGILAVGACDRLYWLRPISGELMRYDDDGITVQGSLCRRPGFGQARPEQLAVGLNHLWLLVRDVAGRCHLCHYGLSDLRPHRQLALDRPLLGIGGDGGDGVWVLLGGDGASAELRAFDPWGGCTCRVPLPEPLNDGRVAVAAASEAPAVFVLEVAAAEAQTAAAEPDFRLWRADGGDVRLLDAVAARSEPCATAAQPPFRPRHLATTAAGEVLLVDGLQGSLWAYEGSSGQRLLTLPQIVLPAFGSVTSFSAGSETWLSGSGGVARLLVGDVVGDVVGDLVDAAAGAADAFADNDAADERVPTFVTPVLVSPPAVVGGFLRAGRLNGAEAPLRRKVSRETSRST